MVKCSSGGAPRRLSQQPRLARLVYRLRKTFAMHATPNRPRRSAPGAAPADA